MLVSGGRVRHDWILLLHFFESAATSGKPLRGVCQLECFYCGGLLCAGQATGGPVPVSAADFKESLIHGGARHCCPDSVWHGARRKWMNIHDQRATKPRWMRAATRRASSASPERSDADFHPIPFQVLAGGAMDQTFPKLLRCGMAAKIVRAQTCESW